MRPGNTHGPVLSLQYAMPSARHSQYPSLYAIVAAMVCAVYCVVVFWGAYPTGSALETPLYSQFTGLTRLSKIVIGHVGDIVWGAYSAAVVAHQLYCARRGWHRRSAIFFFAVGLLLLVMRACANMIIIIMSPLRYAMGPLNYSEDHSFSWQTITVQLVYSLPWLLTIAGFQLATLKSCSAQSKINQHGDSRSMAIQRARSGDEL